MKILFFALISVALVAGDQSWEKFKTSNGKNYSHPVVNALRKELFLRADAMIVAHNRGNHSWQMGHNFLSDMTEEEKQMLLGAREPTERYLQSFASESDEDVNSLTIDRQSLPSSVDYRTDKCMSPVKNQGGCGSCWAFGAINPLEFANCRKNNKLNVLSEQQLVDCVYRRSGCDGGWPDTAYDYFLKAKGSALSSLYPYTAKWSSCAYKSSMKGAALLKYVSITNADKATAMMQALVQNSTISVAIHVAKDWGSYRSGVYSSTTVCDQNVNHAVVVVGYGTQQGLDYWVVRNSWGPRWGDKGYILMRRGINQCRIESSPTYVSAV